MKISSLVLVGSLAANAVLIGALVVGSTSEPVPALATPAVSAAATKITVADEPAAPGPETWTKLEAADLAMQRDRLRAAGFPPEIVRAILAAQINDSFAARRKAITDAQGERPFWKPDARDPKTQAALRDLGLEQQKMLKDLLGRDARDDDDPRYAAYLRNRFGDLPADKVDRLRDIQEDIDRQRSEIYSARGSGPGALLPEEAQKLRELDQKLRDDFASVLTPQELADYDLRASNTANALRYNLGAFDPSEQEYRAIFALQQAFDEKYNRRYGGPPMTPDEMKDRSDAQKKLQNDLKAALGDDRYADYQRAWDYSYKQTAQLVARLELPAEIAKQIYATQQDANQRTAAIRNDSSLDAAARTSRLQALAAEATAKISSALGPAGFEAYQQNDTGVWLRNLLSRPAPPASTGGPRN